MDDVEKLEQQMVARSVEQSRQRIDQMTRRDEREVVWEHAQADLVSTHLKV